MYCANKVGLFLHCQLSHSATTPRCLRRYALLVNSEPSARSRSSYACISERVSRSLVQLGDKVDSPSSPCGVFLLTLTRERDAFVDLAEQLLPAFDDASAAFLESDRRDAHDTDLCDIRRSCEERTDIRVKGPEELRRLHAAFAVDASRIVGPKTDCALCRILREECMRAMAA